MSTHLIYFGCLALFCFAFATNSFLRGRLSPLADGVLGLIIVIMAVSSGFVFRWFYIPVAFFAAFLLIRISKPLAGGLARKLVGYRTGFGSPQWEAQPTEDFLAGRSSLEEMLAGLDKKAKADASRLRKIANRPAIHTVLAKAGLTSADFCGLFDLLKRAGLSDLAWDILQSPSELERLIALSREGKTPVEIAIEFRRVD